jgi:hypothetical protein
MEKENKMNNKKASCHVFTYKHMPSHVCIVQQSGGFKNIGNINGIERIFACA